MHCKWAYKKHKTDRVNSSFIHDSFIDVTHYGEGGALTIEGEDGCCYSQASPGTNCAYEQSSIVYLENFHGGGGICFTSSKGLVFLQECTFIRCSAFNGRGGASFLSYKPTKYASVKFERCKFFSNSANEHGNDIATVSDWADLIQCTDLCHECESNSLSPKVSIGDDDKEDFWITGECGNKYTDPVSDDPKDILVGTIVCCVALFFIVFIVRMVIVRCQHVEWIFDDTSEFSIELMDEECDTDECVNRPPTPDPPSPGVASYLNNLPNENAPTESNRIEFIQ
ncbi:uncharacterized protein MONOS_11264 [Monocercomonoides exilis]|uniref:uncharacterized protein n=1 Tax=Monocercomonoides exilis TaxID=2049356 RepID=UPI003559DC3F|nr:hypothetical protein MONOS_11264 [Monocercomonoides exilis]|eukprot:MONOS_11264.1-p1 / transcript=MONOS_11264.1 / gene=MONOS_11264 / organism=Monocercomonoides_exilis_PA203 / gene_product=unspecified product / transcript_product=unspecified product / location=Mono_scaffold00555:33544-34761(-) / protein_length=283 / sequence_SO=supercontig / SO=protein_coding / is_pseudo=false